MRLPLFRSLGRSGQFIPISAMVMFTTVVFMVAVSNIYKVTRAKLKVQNLADAVALNISSQMASSMNKAADLNEWMNHFIDPGPNGPASQPGKPPPCVGIDPNLPPLSCAENRLGSKNLNMFASIRNAQSYGKLVQTINKSQDLFSNTYNNFIGAGTSSRGGSANGSLWSILLSDIPDLKDTHVIVWNTKPPTQQPAMASNANSNAPPLDTNGMQELKFKTHDIIIGYWNEKCVLGICHKTNPQYRTLGDVVLFGEKGEGKNNVVPEPFKIGWKEFDYANSPHLDNLPVADKNPRVGAGAEVSMTVQMAWRTITVSARSQAFVVKDSGVMGIDPSIDLLRPVFKPTYWVKLAGVHS